MKTEISVESKHQTLQGLAFPLQPEAQRALQQLKQKTVNYIQMVSTQSYNMSAKHRLLLFLVMCLQMGTEPEPHLLNRSADPCCSQTGGLDPQQQHIELGVVGHTCNVNPPQEAEARALDRAQDQLWLHSEFEVNLIYLVQCFLFFKKRTYCFFSPFPAPKP